MPHQVSNNIAFFSSPDDTTQALTPLAETIIERCRSQLNLVILTDERKKLDEIINGTARLLYAVQQHNSRSTIAHKIEDLQSAALALPPKLTAKKRLSDVGYTVAQVSLFLFVTSIALSVGTAFYALCYKFLTLQTFLDGLVFELAGIGLPAGILGSFGYALHKSDDHKAQSSDIESLQEKINAFCNEASKHMPAKSSKRSKLKANSAVVGAGNDSSLDEQNVIWRESRPTAIQDDGERTTQRLQVR